MNIIVLVMTVLIINIIVLGIGISIEWKQLAVTRVAKQNKKSEV